MGCDTCILFIHNRTLYCHVSQLHLPLAATDLTAVCMCSTWHVVRSACSVHASHCLVPGTTVARTITDRRLLRGPGPPTEESNLVQNVPGAAEELAYGPHTYYVRHMMCAAALLVGPYIRNTCSRKVAMSPYISAKHPSATHWRSIPTPQHSILAGRVGGVRGDSGREGTWPGRRVSWHNEPPTLAPT